jgi:phosphomannomutase
MPDYSSAFKAYDIRALWGDPLDEQFFYALGYGIGKHLVERYGEHASLVFGADSREENTQIIYRFLKGVALAGKVQCVNAWLPVTSVEGQTHPWGCCSTAMLYWIAREQFSLGISFTASHNPFWYVGCKVVDRAGQLLQTSVLAEMIKEYPPLPDFDQWAFDQLTYTTHHRQHPLGERVLARAHEMQTLLWSHAKELQHHVSVIVDCASWAACAYEKQFLLHLASQLPMTFLFLNDRADGTFAAHPTDTTDAHNYLQLWAEVEEVGAVFGAMFDGDADRIGCVDEQGHYIPWDILAVGLVAELLRDVSPGRAVVYDVSCTNALPACITRLWGKAVPSRIGHRYIKEQSDAHDALAGIELSGHLCFAETHGHESPLLALLLIIRGACAHTSMSAWLTQLAPVYKPPLVNLHVVDAQQAIQILQTQFAHLPQDMTDGVKVLWPDRWFLVRASNTEPVIRLYIEAPDKIQYDRLFALIQEALRGE